MKKPAPSLTTLNVRDIHKSAANALKLDAQTYGLTIGQYLHRLALAIHGVRVRAEEDADTAKILETAGIPWPPRRDPIAPDAERNGHRK